MHGYDYAVIYLVPDVALDERWAVGLALHSRTARFLGWRTAPAERFAEPVPLAAEFLAALDAVAKGGSDSGPIGLFTPSERFHWLTAPRSTVVQPGPVRGGLAPASDVGLAMTFAALCRSARVDVP